MENNGKKPTSLESKQKFEEMARRREQLLSACMAALATGLGVEITPQRVILYQRPLSDLSDQQIKRGFERALKEYKPYGGSFPSPAELRDYALRMDPARFRDDAPEVLGRSEKPDDWEPGVRVDEIKRQIAEKDPCRWPE